MRLAAALHAAACILAIALSACGPQIGELERGEEGRVVRTYNGDTLELDSGLRVFLAEIDAPRGEDEYAAQAQGELEALALHRDVLLAYGGARRWIARPRENQTAPPPEAAIAAVVPLDWRARAASGRPAASDLLTATVIARMTFSVLTSWLHGPLPARNSAIRGMA